MLFSEYCEKNEVDEILTFGTVGLYCTDDDWVVAHLDDFGVFLTLKRAMDEFAVTLSTLKYPQEITFNHFMDLYLDLKHMHTFGSIGLYSGYSVFFVRDFDTEKVYVCESIQRAIKKTAELV